MVISSAFLYIIFYYCPQATAELVIAQFKGQAGADPLAIDDNELIVKVSIYDLTEIMVL